MKCTIKNNEEHLNKIIRECLQEVVDEKSINAKQRDQKNIENVFKKGEPGYNAIKTIAVFTAENPDSQAYSNAENRPLQKSLYRDLKGNGYIIKSVKGKFGSTEHPYMVLNIELDTCKFLCGKYQQTSFVFHRLLDDGTLVSEYWEKSDTTKPYRKGENDYVKKDETTEWVDMSNADDIYTTVGQSFKYQIPFPYLMECNSVINENLDKRIEYQRKRGFYESKDSLMHMIMGTGQFPVIYRKSILEEIEKTQTSLYPLNIDNGNVVLKHDSGAKITNGVISRPLGVQNSYSNNSDVGNYFWGSETTGKDQSNHKKYTYYCFVPLSDVYDMNANPKGYYSVKDAADNEKYVAVNWPRNNDAVAVVSKQPTPIDYIVDNNGDEGRVYDAEWNMLRASGLPRNRAKLNVLASKLEPYRNVKLPDCLSDCGYTYDDVIDLLNSEEMKYYP